METKSTKGPLSRLTAVFILAVAVFVPSAARAAVSINEIMYNPAGADTGREWVELYNSGSADVTLVGGSGKGSWRIADSSNHTITDPQGGVGRGSLVVPAGGYLVLASDPATFMGEFSGSYSVAKASLSLNNTGSTVSLIDGTGTVVDSFAYTPSIGGNDTGASLQLASSTWIPALPTPGATNATEANDPAPADTSSSSNGHSASTAAYIAPPLPQLFADAGGDKTVIVGADTKFVATAYDRDKSVINYAKFLWNFGDGSVAEGPEIMHHFSYPGLYAVELMIKNDLITSSTRIKVTAEPAAVTVEVLPLGGVSVKNLSGRDLDLSFWRVVDGTNAFVLPEHSVVLKGAAINISAATLGFAATDAKLYYPDGTEVVPPVTASANVVEAAPEQKPEEPTALSKGSSAKGAPFAQASSTVVLVPDATSTATTTEASTTPVAVIAPSESVAAASTSGVEFPLWASATGLGGIMGLGIMSVVYARRRAASGATQSEAEEFEIGG